ncbi:MAG: methyltransferase domain-containing protein [Chitinivibrionales bacterium]|nr:methyltransferase domain-containing protein [Chitinivibrionales bacterium]
MPEQSSERADPAPAIHDSPQGNQGKSQAPGRSQKRPRGAGYVDSSYLAVLAEKVGPLKRRTCELLGIGDGDRVLDVGCGPATDTIALARIVGERGFVAGVDADEEMVAVADRRAREAGVAGRVSHQVGRADALTFGDSSFSACRSERLFQHLESPARALAEMIRVTRPAGRIVVADTDHTTLTIDCRGIDREWRFRQAHVARLRCATAARSLPRLFSDAGLSARGVEVIPFFVDSYALTRSFLAFDEVEAFAVAEGFLSAADVQAFRDECAERDAKGTFFACVNMIVAYGTRIS